MTTELYHTSAGGLNVWGRGAILMADGAQQMEAVSTEHTTTSVIVDEATLHRLLTEIEREYRKLAADGRPFQIVIHSAAWGHQCEVVSQSTRRTKISRTE